MNSEEYEKRKDRLRAEILRLRAGIRDYVSPEHKKELREIHEAVMAGKWRNFRPTRLIRPRPEENEP